jgi:hypothetical protein
MNAPALQLGQSTVSSGVMLDSSCPHTSAILFPISLTPLIILLLVPLCPHHLLTRTHVHTLACTHPYAHAHACTHSTFTHTHTCIFIHSLHSHTHLRTCTTHTYTRNAHTPTFPLLRTVVIVGMYSRPSSFAAVCWLHAVLCQVLLALLCFVRVGGWYLSTIAHASCFLTGHPCGSQPLACCCFLRFVVLGQIGAQSSIAPTVGGELLGPWRGQGRRPCRGGKLLAQGSKSACYGL